LLLYLRATRDGHRFGDRARVRVASLTAVANDRFLSGAAGTAGAPRRVSAGTTITALVGPMHTGALRTMLAARGVTAMFSSRSRPSSCPQ
jgi:hypothetical protein